MLQSCTRLRCTTITKYEIVGPKLIWGSFEGSFWRFFSTCVFLSPLEDFCRDKILLLWVSSVVSVSFLAFSSILIVFA